MRLSRISIKNFKGIDSLEIAMNGRNVTISGENGTGKTTVADAYAWVLFGKSFAGDSIEPEIKKRDEITGQTPNDGGIVHSVELELSLDNGADMLLRKEYMEKWVKKRGSAENELQGHTTVYYMDDIPLTQKEYGKRLAKLLPEEAARLLSVPLYFCTNLKWQERRKILMDMCDDIKDSDVIASDSKLASLEKMLDGKSIDDYRASVKAQIKKVNEELKNIPARIDELTKVETEVQESEREAFVRDLKNLTEKHKEATARLALLENGGEVAELKKSLAEKEARMTKLKASLESEYTKRVGEAESIVRGCVAEAERLSSEMEWAQGKVEQLETINATTDAMAQKLRDEWGIENAKKAEIDVSDTCPCCGQKLPPSKLQESRENALAEFNRKKAEILTEISEKGKRMMVQKEKNAKEIQRLKETTQANERRIKELTEKKAEAEKMIADAAKPDVSTSEEYRLVEGERDAIMAKIELAKKCDNTEAISAAKEDIKAIELGIDMDNKKLAAIAQAENVRKRKEELMAREKELGEIYNGLESSLFLSEKFIRAKVRMVEESINKHFRYVRFKMFHQQINGGLEECCIPTINGVPFDAGLNTGGEMKAALDILGVLSDHFGMHLPIIIDNCESYTKDSIIETENQMIRLVVTEGQKVLSVEIDGQGKQEMEAVRKTAA